LPVGPSLGAAAGFAADEHLPLDDRLHRLGLDQGLEAFGGVGVPCASCLKHKRYVAGLGPFITPQISTFSAKGRPRRIRTDR
jgi:hypothetical protein